MGTLQVTNAIQIKVFRFFFLVSVLKFYGQRRALQLEHTNTMHHEVEIYFLINLNWVCLQREGAVLQGPDHDVD